MMKGGRFYEPVFRENQANRKIEEMRKMLTNQGSAKEIQQLLFFPKNCSQIELTRLTQNHITKGSKVLTQKHKTALKALLKQHQSGFKFAPSAEVCIEPKTSVCMTEEDREIERYLTFQSEIEFSEAEH